MVKFLFLIPVKNSMIKGKCNCGKKATSEWITYGPFKRRNKRAVWTNKFCDKCAPERESENMIWTYGKNKPIRNIPLASIVY